MKALIALYIFFAWPISSEQIANTESVIKIIKDTDDETHILLKATDCDILDKQANAIRQWSESIGEPTVANSHCSCHMGATNELGLPELECSIDVTNISPLIVNQLHGERPAFSGPNCWNTSLVAAKILPHPRYSSADEMEFWMNSPLCQERPIDEEPQPGDVIAIRKNGNEYHGFIFISPEISFSKNGFYQGQPYGIMPTQYVYNVYKVQNNCQRVDHSDENCNPTTQILSCQSWDSFIGNGRLGQIEDKTMREIERIECLVSKKSLYNDVPDFDKDFISKNLDALNYLAVSNGGQLQRNKNYYDDVPLNQRGPASEKETNLFWDSIRHRINSLTTQLSNLWY